MINPREKNDSNYIDEIKIIAPLAVYLPRKTKKDLRIAVNLNIYRNLHYVVNNNVKKIYAAEIDEYIKGKKIKTPVTIEYRVYKQSKRRLDKMNVISVTSKYLMDAVSEAGVWEDDNDDFVKTEVIYPTRLDKKNPRCEITIRHIKEEENNLVNINEYDKD